jgi:hypothetical protein
LSYLVNKDTIMGERENFIKVILRRILIFKKFIWSGFRIIVFKPYWHDRYINSILFTSIFLNLIDWAYLTLNRTSGDYPIILHYNLFFGVDFLGNYNMVFLIPLVGVMVFVANSLLGHIFYKAEKLAAYILTINIFLVQCFLLLASYLIVAVNK